MGETMATALYVAVILGGVLRSAGSRGARMRLLRKTHWAIRLRLALLLPFSCNWNRWVRDFTARLERPG